MPTPADELDDPDDGLSPLCGWAPSSHRAQAAYMLRFAWPCGHLDPMPTPSCVQCTARVRAKPVPDVATDCMECGAIGPCTLVAVTSTVLTSPSPDPEE